MALSFFRQSPRILGHARNRALAGPYPVALEAVLPRALCDEAFAEIRSWPGYEPTPLLNLDRLAGALGVGAALYKDESRRFGLGSFKPLATAYAVNRLLADRLGLSMAEIRAGLGQAKAKGITVTTASDGNLGRALAWAARQLGCRCRVYLHAKVSKGRAKVIADFGAKVVRIEGTYEDTVRRCDRDSARNGWIMVSDIASSDPPEIPYHVMAGYSVIASEIADQTDKPVTHVFIPAASGGLAAALAARLWMMMGAARPRIVVIESDSAACLQRSARRGFLARIEAHRTSVMTGLSCGLPSPEAWEILRRAASDFVTIGDGSVAAATRMLASGRAGGGPIEAGECATPGPIALIAAASNKVLRTALGLDAQSRVLMIGTEGATDPDIYKRLMTEGDPASTGEAPPPDADSAARRQRSGNLHHQLD